MNVLTTLLSVFCILNGFRLSGVRARVSDDCRGRCDQLAHTFCVPFVGVCEYCRYCNSDYPGCGKTCENWGKVQSSPVPPTALLERLLPTSPYPKIVNYTATSTNASSLSVSPTSLLLDVIGSSTSQVKQIKHPSDVPDQGNVFGSTKDEVPELPLAVLLPMLVIGLLVILIGFVLYVNQDRVKLIFKDYFERRRQDNEDIEMATFQPRRGIDNRPVVRAVCHRQDDIIAGVVDQTPVNIPEDVEDDARLPKRLKRSMGKRCYQPVPCRSIARSESAGEEEVLPSDHEQEASLSATLDQKDLEGITDDVGYHGNRTSLTIRKQSINITDNSRIRQETIQQATPTSGHPASFRTSPRTSLSVADGTPNKHGLTCGSVFIPPEKYLWH